MARAFAYCVELGKDVSLRQAHEKFFEQPEDRRKRFTFMCGDPKCRAVARPKIVGAVYDRTDAFNETAIASGRHRAPYFRSHVRFPHIDDCTWHESALDSDRPEKPERPDQAINNQELGLIWLPEAQERRDGGGGWEQAGIDQPENGEEDGDNSHKPAPQRADSTRFLATVGMNYLHMTVAQRQATPLRIGRKGEVRTFYDTCLPIFSFHPTFQSERIYCGKASIAELDNVFVLTFVGKSKFAPSGERSARDTIPKVKFLKRSLDEDDRQLAEILTRTAAERELVHCFLYVTDPPTIDVYGSERRGWFTPTDSDHIFVAPVSMVATSDEGCAS